MARIQTYDQDSNVTFQDKLIGTDSASSATKNFTIQSLMDVINQLSGIDLFDGIVFKYQAFEPAATDPAGAINLVGGAAATQAFSATTQIIVSKKVVNGIDVENYVTSFLGKKIKVSKQGDFDKFGVFRVTNVQNHSNTRYLVLTVTHKESNGNFEPNSYYFLSFYGLPLVTDLEDVTNAGSGLIITNAERTTLGTSLQPADIIDNVTSTDTNKVLSANQGKILKDLVDGLTALLDVDAADKPALDTLREVVNFCQVNAATLSSLGISSIAGLQAALNAKVDVVTGKALSENDFTNALLTKLNGIAAGAQVNVKPDFSATTGAADEILNIPSDITDLSAHNVTELSDVNTAFFTGSTAAALTDAGSGSIITNAERTKLGAIDVNLATSTITDGTDSITVATSSRTIEVAGTTNEIEVSPTGAQDLSTDRTFTVGLPNDVTIGNNLTAVGNVTGASLIKSGGTSGQILLADGSVIDLTTESQGINSNDSDTKIPSNAAVKDAIDNAVTVTQHSNIAKTMIVTVVTKTASHPAHGSGSTLGYSIDGIESPEITFAVGNTYKFDQSDSSNSSHPLRFYYDENKTTQYTAGVTTAGTPGQTGAYTQIVPSQSTPNVLYYQCSAHNNMGWKTVFNTRNLTGFSTNDLTEGTNLYYTDARFDTRLSLKDTGDLSEGSNLYYTDARVLAKINSTSVDALSDVDTTTSAPSSGQALVWNGSNFVPNTVGSTLTVQEEGSALSNAATVLNFVGSGVTASGSGGTKTITIGGSIDDLSDVDITSNAPSAGQILKWDGTNFVPGTDNSGSAASDSFTTISVSGQTNVVADSSSDTLTLAAGNNMTITTDSSTDTITLAATGGAGQIVKQSFNGTGSQAAFTLSNTISDIDNISVYVSGVLQYPSNYTVSGTDITFVAGSIPASGTNNIHVIHTTAAPNVADVGTVFLDQFTGDGTSTQFSPLSTAPTSEDLTDVYIDGIYQQKNAYSISGTQIDFGSGNAPVNGAYIEVKTTGSIAPSAVTAAQTTLVSDAFTATSGQTSFTLVNGSPSSKELTMVFVQGVYQAKTNYSLNSGAIVFSSGVTLGDTVEVISLSGANLTTSPVTSVNGQTGVVSIAGGVTSVDGNTGAVTSAVTSVNGQTGAVTVASTMGVNVISSNTTATANNLYVFTANLTLTLPASPSAGDSIKISNRSGVATCVLGRNGNNIMGSASDLTIDALNAGLELIYSGASEGWIIIGN